MYVQRSAHRSESEATEVLQLSCENAKSRVTGRKSEKSGYLKVKSAPPTSKISFIFKVVTPTGLEPVFSP